MRSRIVRLAGLLLGVVLAVILWRWSERDEPGRGVQGGPLFQFAPSEVVRLEVRRTGGTDTLVRTDGGWRLAGRVDDLVDGERMDASLATLVEGEGFPVLPGTEPDARRFGFADEGALELVFHLRDGGRRRLALGDPAPVSSQIYASGAGRPGVFGVGGRYFMTAARLPDSVRLPRLLPALELAALDSLRLERRGDAPLVFHPDAVGRWWLRLPAGTDDLVGLAAAYHARYDDRRRGEGGATWVGASRRRLADLVFRATDTAVMRFLPPDTLTPALLADAGLAPPYRTVVMHAPERTWRVAFGEEQAGRRVLARREEAVVVTRAEALSPAEGYLSDFLDLGALGFALADADSFHVDRPDRPLLRGRRAGDPRRRFAEGRSPWDAVAPPGWRFVFSPAEVANHLHDLQVYLDRLAIRDVLPAAADDPLSGSRRWRVTAWLPGAERRTVWLGERATDGQPVLWEPAGGRLVVVDGEILTTLHNLRGDLRPEQ